MSVFSSLPKKLVVIDGLMYQRDLTQLRSHHIVHIMNCKGAILVIRPNQRCHQVIMSDCQDTQLLILDSAVIASRTIRLSNCHQCSLTMEDVDIRRVEVWNSSKCDISVFGDDILMEETNVIWNEGCTENRCIVGDLLRIEEEDGKDDDLSAGMSIVRFGTGVLQHPRTPLPSKVLQVFKVPNVVEANSKTVTDATTATTLLDSKETTGKRFLTTFRPLTYVHTVPLNSEEAESALAHASRFILPTLSCDVLEAPSKSSTTGAGGKVFCFHANPDPIFKELQSIQQLNAANPITSDMEEKAYDEERVELCEKDPSEIQRKAKQCAEFMKQSKYVIVFSGAGISTAANIPDFRGPQGLWTLRDKNEISAVRLKGLNMESAFPTYSHYAITELARAGFVKYVISTNMDGLHCRSGLPRTQIAEMHGSAYKEYCPTCRQMYTRAFDVGSTWEHHTGRKCSWCKTKLVDTIVNFAETYRDPMDQISAAYHARQADFSLVLGTSMAVQPAVTYPLKVLDQSNGKMVLVNRQHTPADPQAFSFSFC